MPIRTRLLALLLPLTLAAPATQADVVISSAATQNMSCSGGVCAPTAEDAVLNVGDLTTMLQAGNVSVLTSGSGVQANNITVASKFGWKSAHSLTLDAFESITVNQRISANGHTEVNLVTDDGGSGGTLFFGPKGQIQFRQISSGLEINGVSFVLVNSVATLASALGENPSGNYALAADYDASGDGTYDGFAFPEVDGAIQGLGNAISNLSAHYQSRKQQVSGVFQQTGTAGSIQSLRLINERAHVEYAAQWGGLVGRSYGTLFNDYVSGKFMAKGANTAVAGLAALSYNEVLYSAAVVKISGIVEYAAGLVGASTGEIVGCHAAGSIMSKNAGGLVLYNKNSVDQSYSTTKLNGGAGAMLGGLIWEENGSTTNSYATGSVSGGDGSTVGGFVGSAIAPIDTSYSTGAVSGGDSSLVGGFIGDDSDATISEAYWDTTTSGADNGTGEGNVSGLTGLTTEQLQSGLPAGFDPTIWAENPNINGGLPYLINNPPETK